MATTPLDSPKPATLQSQFTRVAALLSDEAVAEPESPAALGA